MKLCVTCKAAKPLSAFHRSRVNHDGLHKQCKECRKQGSQATYELHKEAISARAKTRYAQNRNSVIAAARRYAEQNREAVAHRQAAYYRANKTQRRLYRKEHYAKNVERYLGYQAARRSDLRRLPGWADIDAIELMYKTARLVSKRTGVAHHVDHIVPLRGETVCGLHVQNNLRVVPASVNLAKKNRLEESTA